MSELCDEMEPEATYELGMRVRGTELAGALRAEGVAEIVNHPEWPEYQGRIGIARLLAEVLPKLDAIGQGRVEVVVRFSPDGLSRRFDRVSRHPEDLRKLAFTENLVESREEVFEYLRRVFAWEDANSKALSGTAQNIQLERASAEAAAEQVA